MSRDALARAAEQLRSSTRVTVLTGAGVSAASGVPTFRGNEGLWRTFRAEELATPSAFARDPRLVWEWYDWRRTRIAQVAPNPAHQVLAAWEARFPALTLITQNVDGLHERAGSRRLVRLHGSIWEMACWNGCGERWHDASAPLPELPPRCPRCGGLARPGVVWFGEMLAPDDIDRAVAATACDLFMTVGTSAVVYPAAGLVHEAARRGAYTIEINPATTEASSQVDLVVRAGAAEALPAIDALVAGA